MLVLVFIDALPSALALGGGPAVRPGLDVGLDPETRCALGVRRGELLGLLFGFHLDSPLLGFHDKRRLCDSVRLLHMPTLLAGALTLSMALIAESSLTRPFH